MLSRHLGTSVAAPERLSGRGHAEFSHRKRTNRHNGRQIAIRVNAKWASKKPSGKPKVPPKPSAASKQKPASDPAYKFEWPELPDLPNLDDVRADRVIRGSLFGTLVGTALSLVVSPIQYVLAASAVASGVSLVPYFDAKDLKSTADDKGAELPGEAAATIISQGQDIADGATTEGSTTTVAAAALVAGSTVSLFAAKSLPLVFGASAVYVAAQADNNLNLGASTLRGRDFLRSRKEAGVGIIFTLIALQARRAVDALTAWNQGQATLRPAIAGQSAFSEGPIEGSFQQARSRTPSPAGRVSSLHDSGKTPKSQLHGSPDDSENPLTTGKAPAESFEPSLSDSLLGGQQSSSTKGFEPSLQDSLLQSGPVSASSSKDEKPTPLEKAKGGNKDVGAGDLATGPVKTKEVEPILKPDSPATQTPGKGTPLEKVKGGNADVKSGDLATGKPDFASKEKDALLKPGSGATKGSSPSTPLENVKGGNKDVSTGDLTTGKADFSQNKDGLLTGGSPATQTPSNPATPLEKVKGGNTDVSAGDLTTGKADFSQNKEGLLTGKSPATKTPGKETPLENVKGSNRAVKAGDLTSGKTEFEVKDDKALLQPDSAATKVSGDSTPLENVKGGNKSASPDKLSTGPISSTQADVSKLGSGSPSTLAPGQSTPLENVKGGNRDIGVGDLATGPASFKAAAQEPVLQGTSPIGAGTSPLESLKGSQIGRGPIDYERYGASFSSKENGQRNDNSLLLQSSTGDGKALQLHSFKADAFQPAVGSAYESGKSALDQELLKPSATSRAGATLGAGKQALLNNLAQKQDASKSFQAQSSNSPGKSVEASSSAKSIIAKPFEIGKSALEQTLPATQAGSPKRSAAGPSEISKLAKGAAPAALVRPVSDSSAIEGLQKPESVGSSAVPALSPRANINVSQPTKKRSFVDNLLVVAGSGLLGSLLGVIYYLVNGQTIGHQVPRTLLTIAFVCITAVILLVSFGKRSSQAPAIATNAA